jgi:hypothetical protein
MQFLFKYGLGVGVKKGQERGALRIKYKGKRYLSADRQERKIPFRGLENRN